MIAMVSLVLMWPSIVMRLKEDSTEFLRHSSSSEAGIETSVVRKQSMVAMFGAIIPAPLVIPPTITSLLFIFNLTAMSFCFVFFQAEDGIRDDLVTGVQTVLFR